MAGQEYPPYRETACECPDSKPSNSWQNLKNSFTNLMTTPKLPPREKELINELVKTRVVYDSIRNQLILNNPVDDVTFKKSPDYKAFKRRSDVVIKIIDLVDKGDFPPLKRGAHGICCDCCLCKTRAQIPKHLRVKMTPAVLQQLEKYNNRIEAVKMHAIHSEPCMCLLKFKDVLHKIPSVSSMREKMRTGSKASTSSRKQISVQISPKKKKLVSCKCSTESKSKRSDGKKNKGNLTYTGEMQELTVSQREGELKTVVLEETLEMSDQPKTQIKEEITVSATKDKQQEFKPSRKQSIVQVEPKKKKTVTCKCTTEPKSKRSKVKKTRGSTTYGDNELLRTTQRKEGIGYENEIDIPKKPMDSLLLHKENLQRKEFTCDSRCKINECIPEECYKKLQKAQNFLEEFESTPKFYAESYPPMKTTYTQKVTKSKDGKTFVQQETVRKRLQVHSDTANKKGTKKRLLDYPRCFCTLELRKKPKVKQKKPVSKTAIKTQSVQTAELHTRRITTVSQMSQVDINLQPHLCGPSFYIPIQSLESTGRKKSKGHTDFTQTELRNDVKYIKRPESGTFSPVRSGNASQENAVKISCGMNFEIQFSKTKIPPNNKNIISDNSVPARSLVMERKPIPRHVKGQTKPKTRHFKGQSSQNSVSSESKMTLTDKENILKRCNCTLKLIHSGTSPAQVSKSKSTTTKPTQDLNIILKSSSTQTRKAKKASVVICECDSKLLPYECEPSFCIPGHCDPIVCDERIRIRDLICEPNTCVPGQCDPLKCAKRLKSKGISTKIKPKSKTMSTKSFSKNNKVQTYRPKQTEQSITTMHNKVAVIEPRYTNPQIVSKPVTSFTSSTQKQAVTIESKCSFSVEFHKTKNTPFNQKIQMYYVKTETYYSKKKMQKAKNNVQSNNANISEPRKYKSDPCTMYINHINDPKNCASSPNLRKREFGMESSCSIQIIFIKNNQCKPVEKLQRLVKMVKRKEVSLQTDKIKKVPLKVAKCECGIAISSSVQTKKKQKVNISKSTITKAVPLAKCECYVSHSATTQTVKIVKTKPPKVTKSTITKPVPLAKCECYISQSKTTQTVKKVKPKPVKVTKSTTTKHVKSTKVTVKVPPKYVPLAKCDCHTDMVQIQKPSPSESVNRVVSIESCFKFNIVFSKQACLPEGDNKPTIQQKTVKKVKTIKQNKLPKAKVDSNKSKSTTIVKEVHKTEKGKSIPMKKVTKTQMNNNSSILNRCFCTLQILPKQGKKKLNTLIPPEQNIKQSQVVKNIQTTMKTSASTSRPTKIKNIQKRTKLSKIQAKPNKSQSAPNAPVTQVTKNTQRVEVTYRDYGVGGLKNTVNSKIKTAPRSPTIDISISPKTAYRTVHCECPMMGPLKNSKKLKSKDITYLPPSTKTVSTRTDKQKLKQPFLYGECPPGICKPNKCNPHKCYEIIKQRNMINLLAANK